MLKFVSYNSNKRAFQTAINIDNQDDRIDFGRLSTLLCKSTITLFTQMFVFYLFIHVTGFYIIDTLKINNVDAHLYEILRSLFIKTTIISICVLSAQLLVLLFYQQFDMNNDLVRHFRNWEIITVTVSLTLLMLLQKNKWNVNLTSPPNTAKYPLMLFGLGVVYLILEYLTRLVKNEKNVLFDTNLESKNRNKVHFAIQLLLVLYIIWQI